MKSLRSLLILILGGASALATAQTTTTAVQPPAGVAKTHTADTVLSQTLGDFLASEPVPPGPGLDSFYWKVPPELEKGVRELACDNYSSAAQEFDAQLAKAKSPRDQARVLYWLGILNSRHAIDYPSSGWQSGTSATTYLRQAIRLDPKVFEAPEAARSLANVVAMGWGNEDPSISVERASKKAEETRRAIDFFYAGCLSYRMAARAWSYSDTTDMDKRTLSLFAKAVARDPGRYESWSAYIPALKPVGLHDLATTEARKMYDHFKNLRTPLMDDQGPAHLFLSMSSYRTMKQDADFLDSLEKQRPDAPYPRFEKAMRAIETSAPLALKLFPQFIANVESGKIHLAPREAGYYPSALYKLAFIEQGPGGMPLEKAEATYRKLLGVSPEYAEANLDLGLCYARQSDALTTSSQKLALLEEALKYVAVQEKLDYHERAALKAAEMGQKLRSLIYHLKEDLKKTDQSTSATADSTSTGSATKKPAGSAKTTVPTETSGSAAGTTSAPASATPGTAPPK